MSVRTSAPTGTRLRGCRGMSHPVNKVISKSAFEGRGQSVVIVVYLFALPRPPTHLKDSFDDADENEQP